MTFEIPRHVETLRQGRDAPAPSGVSVTAARIASTDFSLLDLAEGGVATLVVHRVPGPLPGRSARLQYRAGNAAPVTLPLPVGPGVHRVEGLVDGQETPVALRVSDFDIVTGAEVFGDWSPAKAVTTSRFAAENLLSETVDPVADAAGRWDPATLWAGPVDGAGFATLASPAARQGLVADERALLAEGPVTVLAQATLRQGGAGSVRLALAGSGTDGTLVDVAARLDWAGEAVSLEATTGASDVHALIVDRDTAAGTARLLLVATLDGGAGGALDLVIEGSGTAIALPDLRLWQPGAADWPLPEPVTGASRAGRRLPPVVQDFGDATLEAVAENAETMPFTLFGNEIADSRARPSRALGIVAATIVAPGSGYADGRHEVAVAGGRGGRLRITVEAGAVAAVEILSEGIGYASASLDLAALPGGSGAEIAVTTGEGRDYWPALNDGATRAAWGGRALGQDGFEVEGVLLAGSFHPRQGSAYSEAGHRFAMDAEGHWTADARGLTEALSEDEGERQVVGVVVTNGGVRRVLAMPLGFAGARPRKAKIVGMPRLFGSARWGDLMRVLPGDLRDAVPGRAEVSYAWLLDGAELPGATGPVLRLSPAVAAIGQQIQARVTWRDGAVMESWETPAVTVATWKVVADGDALVVGRLTPAGLAGLPIGPAGTRITAGGSGDWLVSDREGVAFLSPAAGPATPGSDPRLSGEAVLAADYALTLSDGRVLDVATEADAYSVNGVADLAALAQAPGAAAGQAVHGFDFASGGRIVLWNGGDWGHVDDPADPSSRLTDLVFAGGDADGGQTQLVVAPYDPVEPTVVTGPVHLALARNLAWRVDRAHAPAAAAAEAADTPFAGQRLFAADRIGRGVVIEDCRIEGAAFMPERLARPADPAGILFGGPALPEVPGGTPALRLSNVAIRDLAAVFDTALGRIEIEDCRIARCGARPLRFALTAGAGAEAGVTLRRTAMLDAIGAGALNPGAWLEILPDGADGFAPTYRPGLPVTVEDCVMLPGQTAAPAMAGIRLARDAALGDGSAEADWGVVYSPLVLRRVLMVTGSGEGVAVSSGAAGTIEDVSVLADARAGDARPAIRHGNPFRPLDAAFEVTRSVAHTLALPGAGAGDGGVALGTDGQIAAFAGGVLAQAPRGLSEAATGFAPVVGGPLDPDGTGPVAGAVGRDGTLKAALALPAGAALAWGVSSWGRASMQSGIGWGEIPEQAEGAFRIVASRLSGPAPLGVHVFLDGLGVEERLLDDVLWDFGEDYEFDALPLESRARRSSRYALGYAAVHVFKTIGQHRITATLRRRDGLLRETSIDVEVTDPDFAFPGPRTVCLSVNGDFTGAPPGALLTGTWAGLMNIVSDGMRVLLRAGETIGFTGESFRIRETLYVGRFGDPDLPNPVIRPTAPTTSEPFWLQASTDAVFTGVDYVDYYDPADPAPVSEHPELSINRSLTVSTRPSIGTLIFGCRITNCGIGGYLERRGIIANTVIRDWYDYGVFGPSGNEVTGRGGVSGGIAGCWIAQDPAAADFLDVKTPNRSDTPNGADHGPIRLAETGNTVITQNHLESWNGWTIIPDAEGNNVSAHQPCIRFNVTRKPLPGDGGVIADNHMVGGIVLVATGTNVSSEPIGPKTGTLITRNFLVGSTQTRVAIGLAMPNVTVSNNIFTKEIVGGVLRGLMRTFVLNSIEFHNAAGIAAPRWVVNNTIAADEEPSERDFAIVEGPESTPNLVMRDNAVMLDLFPNASDFPETGPLDNFAPRPGGPLDDAATGQAPLRDFRGRLRGLPAAKGALEPFVPEILDLGAGAGSVSVATGAVLQQTGRMTLAARIARDGAGSRSLILDDEGTELTLLSPSGRIRLRLMMNDATALTDTVLDGLAGEGGFVSLMLAVDLAGGLSGGRTVSLHVDGVERHAQTTAPGALLADPAGTTLFAGSAAARLAHGLWLDTSVALDPALHWDSFFDAGGEVRNLEPAGRAAGTIPAIYYVATPAGLGQPGNRGSGGPLMASGSFGYL